MADTVQGFRHRHNADGTYDSICIQCFRTLATGKTEAELIEPENDHVCKGFDLEHLFYSTEK